MDVYKLALYFLIAFGSALSASEKLDWKSVTSAIVAGLVAMKALGSNPERKNGRKTASVRGNRRPKQG